MNSFFALNFSLRHLKYHKCKSILNIFGLALGMASSCLIGLWIHDELSYEKHHVKANHIVRIARGTNDSQASPGSALTNYQLAPKLETAFPQINAVRLGLIYGHFSKDDHHFEEDDVFLADSDIFEVFTFQFVSGDAKTVLSKPNSMVITQRMAEKYFGKQDAMGQTLEFNDVLFQIKGIIKESPASTHFHVNFLLSMESAPFLYSDLYLDNLRSIIVLTYALLPEPTTPEAFENKLPQFVKEHWPVWAQPLKFIVQPIKSIHLHSNLEHEVEPNGNMQSITIFMIAAIFILLIVSINHVNLSTVRLLDRSSEVGLRKVLGAGRAMIASQFFSESFIMTMMSAATSIIIVTLVLPVFNELTNKSLVFDIDTHFGFFIGLIFISILIGAASALYPTYLFSRVPPIRAMKQNIVGHFGNSSFSFRNGLIVLQFSITLILMISSVFIFGQLRFMMNHRNGIESRHIISIPMNSDTSAKYTVIKEALLGYPEILGVTGANQPLGWRIAHTRQYDIEGLESDRNPITLNTLIVDHDFLNTLGGEIESGRNFSKDLPSDVHDAYILNESAAEKLSPISVLNKKCVGELYTNAGERSLKEGVIIGIARDFHFSSLHEVIQPVVFNLRSPKTWSIQSMMVKIRSENVNTTLQRIERVMKSHAPDSPLTYTFLDADYRQHYRSEQHLLALIMILSALSISFACLGLLGLTAHVIERRLKEIAIRKIVGASILNIIQLITGNYGKLILLANILSWPLAYLSIQHWRTNFAYKVPVHILFFIGPALFILISAVLIMSIQSIKAAQTNPTNILKYE